MLKTYMYSDFFQTVCVCVCAELECATVLYMFGN